jgi:flavin-dependent dehydrogenase
MKSEDMQQTLAGLPVVIGSSFSGLMMSLRLSEEGIDHVLIGGDPPNDDPRLGESLNECASPELFGRFAADHPECFHSKSHISLLNGEFATQVQLANPNRCRKSTARYSVPDGEWPINRKRLLAGSLTGRTLMHVDRSRLDPIVYDLALGKPQCRFLHALVETLDTEGDVITAVRLNQVTVIENPKYVFDATGFVSPVAKTMQVATESISKTQRVVWTHQHHAEGTELPERWWRRGTNLLKLYEDVDGLDGISWMIPLGDYVSIGISLDHEKFPADKLDKAEVIERLNAAYRRRGVDYPDLFPEQRRCIKELTHRYYLRERAYGANWLLVGGAYIGVWFPSSSGLWTTVAATYLVPGILEQPEELGAKYQAILSPLTSFHDLLDQMIYGDAFQSHYEVSQFWTRWLSEVPSRLGAYLNLYDLHRPIRRQRLGLLGKFGMFCKKYNRLTRLFWIYWTLRTVRQPELAEQSSSFRIYFRPYLFRLKNYLLNLVHFVNPFGKQFAIDYTRREPTSRPAPAKSSASMRRVRDSERVVPAEQKSSTGVMRPN